MDAVENARALVSVAEKRQSDYPIEVSILDDMNHLFQRSHNGSPSQYAQIETTIEPEVLERVIRFLHRTTSVSQ